MGSRKYALAEIAEINSAQYSPKEKWPLIQYLDTGSVTKGHIDSLQQLKPGTDKVPGRARRKVKNGSIVYSMVRPNQEHYALLSNPPANMLASTGFAVIDAKTSVIAPEYLYYALIHPDTTAYFQALAEQVVSTYPTLGRDDLARFEIDVPSLEEQHAIAALLTSFDEKIVLNQQTNDYLAAIAEGLFEKWLRTAEGELTPLSRFAVFNPSTYSPKENWSIVAYVDTGSVTRNHFENPMVIDTKSEKLPSRARRKVQNGDVVYSTVRPNQLHYGIILDPPNNMLVSTGFTVIRDDAGVGGPFIYLALTRPSITTMLQSVAEQSTSAYPSIKSADLEQLEIPMPTKEELDGLKPQLDSLFATIAHNENETKALEELRDTLLPKLMTGEINVSEVELPMQPNNHLSVG